MLTGEAATLIAAVDEGFNAQVALTADLVRFPSVRGEERLAQEFMAAQMESGAWSSISSGSNLTKSVRCQAFHRLPFPTTVRVSVLPGEPDPPTD
jgi:hypothetical protein